MWQHDGTQLSIWWNRCLIWCLQCTVPSRMQTPHSGWRICEQACSHLEKQPPSYLQRERQPCMKSCPALSSSSRLSQLTIMILAASEKWRRRWKRISKNDIWMTSISRWQLQCTRKRKHCNFSNLKCSWQRGIGSTQRCLRWQEDEPQQAAAPSDPAQEEEELPLPNLGLELPEVPAPVVAPTTSDEATEEPASKYNKGGGGRGRLAWRRYFRRSREGSYKGSPHHARA